MILGFYLVYFPLLITLFTLIVINEKIKKVNLDKIVKILSVVLVAALFINVFLPDLFSKRGLASDRTYEISTYAGQLFHVNPGDEFFTYRNVFHAIVRAGFAIGVVTIPFAIFYKKPYINKVVSYIVLPFSILNSIVFFQYFGYFTASNAPSVFGEASRVILQNGLFRTIWFGLINLLQAGLAFYVTVKNREDLKIRSWKELGTFALVALCFIFTNMPIYTAQHILGTYSEVILTIGYPGHFIFMAGVLIEGLAIYFIFRNRSYEDRYILLLVMGLSLLFQYSTFFKTDGVINASRWPLQLCNIAGGFAVITLLTKSEKMYHFTLVVNSLGAFIAIAICDSTFNTGIFYCMNIHYMVEHVNVILVPILCGALKIFKPLKVRDVKHVIFGFVVYWVVVMIFGTTLCTLYKTTGDEFFEGVNFLFMFNKQKSANLIGFVGPIFDINFSIGDATFSLVQPLVLLVFLGLCVGVYFLLYCFLKEKKQKVAA